MSVSLNYLNGAFRVEKMKEDFGKIQYSYTIVLFSPSDFNEFTSCNEKAIYVGERL